MSARGRHAAPQRPNLVRPGRPRPGPSEPGRPEPGYPRPDQLPGDGPVTSQGRLSAPAGEHRRGGGRLRPAGSRGARLGPSLAGHPVSPTLTVGSLILGFMVLFCYIGPLIYRPDLVHVNLALSNQAPSGAHLLGTDPDGIDVLGRLMTGGQLSLEVGVAAGLLAAIIGSLSTGRASRAPRMPSPRSTGGRRRRA